MLPAHLKRYVVEQDYGRYTSVDQEVWRYIMRQLRAFLSVNAHPCYVDGLEKTGIEIDRIPDIHAMSAKLENFGWQAIPVSGFIPPAAFMEIQAHGFLPIASDMRSADHLMYTPAPDIVHEAAGHAPILIDPEFAGYLKSYAQVAQKAIISHEDLAQYEAIRILSDLKEDPASTEEDIAQANAALVMVNKAISHVSEAALLGRMNWWTAEYGLIGSLENPKIFGAGLLSSLGEARSCLGETVRKIPLSIDCINFSYDITEPQPQLFVTPDFAHLSVVLGQLSQQMAYQIGGLASLEKARAAKTVNTVVLNSGLQISGVLKDFLTSEGPAKAASYLQFVGPTQLCLAGREVLGQGKSQHPQGFGSPLGMLEGATKCLSEMSQGELKQYKLNSGSQIELKFQTGAVVRGTVSGTLFADSGRLVLISFRDCTVTRFGMTLFEHAWGVFDMAVGSQVVSVFGGPADRGAFGEIGEFAAKVIPRKQWSPIEKEKHRLYGAVRTIRNGMNAGLIDKDPTTSRRLEEVLLGLESDFPHDWLLRLSLLELARQVPNSSWQERIKIELENLGESDQSVQRLIRDGLELL